MSNRFPLLICLVWTLFIVSAPAAETQPKVLIIGIDGCRPDALELAKTPHLDALIAAGILFEGTDIRKPGGTDQADTVSGPGWSNLLTGVWPDKHRVLDNQFKKPNYKQYPHMFVRLKENRPEAVTASFSTWAPIEGKIVAGANVSRNFSDPPHDYADWDRQATMACAEYLKTNDPDLVICYQGQVDEAGHAHGFHPSVAEYIAAMETVDRNVGELLASVKDRSHAADEDWLTIVCTDHGGQGTGHGNGHSIPEIRTTFLIVSGPAAKQGKSSTPTFQVDVVPTALAHLGVELLPTWELDGRVVDYRRDGRRTTTE
jgi:predicted AlkP superfamily pyrophosphatase or phosphodiesterase